ncbi:MAG TPA: TetR/AcrR family transcriptional regulator [Ktedonobacteraceae bacterium]|nr:TetR/AcrR family transcriptional regulator [Ktedonobacteraceae bacterium]
MTEGADSKRTPKGELARQRILESALQLFGSRGYEETTMREIAAEAGCSPGLTYRYFASKEELVLVLYHNLADELDEYTRDLPPALLPERFHMAIAKQLELMGPHREALGALFGTALNPHSQAGVFSENTLDIRRQTRRTYLGIIGGTKDAPKAAQREDLATVLYGAHLAIVLFWLIDQSHKAWRTQLFLTFLRDMLKLIQPMLWLPPVSQALVRLADIIGPLLGDDRKTMPLPQGQIEDNRHMQPSQ